MASIVVTGGGLTGLTSAMLLAGDGHDVTLVERNPAGPPPGGADPWASWDRPGVGQFRLLHFLQPRCHQILEAELPEVLGELVAAGGLQMNGVADVPPEINGGPRPGDDRFAQTTGRRPVVEAAFARCAERTSGLTVRRGSGVARLVTGTPARAGVPHVAGVVLEDGAEIAANLVVDATGRRSALPALLAAAGARPPYEEMEDLGFVYYARHFRSGDGSLPPTMGPPLMDGEILSVLTLPADNGTWGVGIIASSRDTGARRLRDLELWQRTVQSFPLAAHWLDGEPIDDSVVTMAKLEDRYRRFVVGGEPVVTGLVAVGDSWACTNPSLGRGVGIGMLHALTLRDLLRKVSPDDPYQLALAWDEATEATVTPWYRATNDYDRHRLAEIDAALAGAATPRDDGWELTKALLSAAVKDPDALRALQAVFGTLDLPEVALAAPGLLDKVIALGADWRDDPPLGPSAAQTREILGA